MASQSKVVVLAVGAVIGACLIGAQVVSTPTGASLVSVVSSAAGLPGTSVVNIDSASLDPTEGVIVSYEPVVVYQVPQGRWLLLTDYEVLGATTELVEIAESVVTVKRGYYFTSGGVEGRPYHSATGLAFAPGSQVAIQAPYGPTTVRFTLSGYLTRP